MLLGLKKRNYFKRTFSRSTSIHPSILVVCKSQHVLFQVQVGPGAEKREGPKERSTFWHPAHRALCATEGTATHGASWTATQPCKRNIYRTLYNHVYSGMCGVFALVTAWFFTAESERPGLWEGPETQWSEGCFRRRNSPGFTHVSTFSHITF